MARLPSDRDATGDPGAGGGSTTGTPRWVKVFGIVAIAVVLLVLILLLSGRGHGPSRHTGGGASAAGIPAAAGGHALPHGGR